MTVTLIPDQDRYAAALCSPSGEFEVAEGLASGELHVVNRHSVSPGGLRWASADELSWLDPAPEHGVWLLGTGFVSRRFAT